MSFDQTISFLQSLPSRSYLLGLSGGPDSMALFHLLLEAKVLFHVAHIDHSWRESSAKEAAFIEGYCQEKNIPFHPLVLSSPKDLTNLEDKGRNERLRFFSECLKKEKLSGLFLAHHSDDLAETVLKRVFESAFITNLSALKVCSQYEELIIYRPLLFCTKQQILFYLQENQIPYFEDPTNLDPRFLRGRMREQILPRLSKEFGKNISPTLCRLGKQSQELADFIDQLLMPKLAALHFEANSITSLPDEELLATPFLLKSFLRKIFSLLSCTISENSLEMIFFHLQKNDRKSLGFKGIKIIIKNKVISFFPEGPVFESRLFNLSHGRKEEKTC